jgi:hypothetical protein
MERERAVVIGLVVLTLAAFVWFTVDDGVDDASGRADPPDPAAHECQPASATLVSAIEEGLAGHHLIGARIVRSDDFEHRYHVAGTVNGTVAVFVTDDLDGGTIRALDERTAAVAEWPLDDGAQSDDAFAAIMSCSIQR